MQLSFSFFHKFAAFILSKNCVFVLFFLISNFPFSKAGFTELREREEQHHKELSDLCLAYLERFLKGEADNAMDLPDDLNAVCFVIIFF